MLLNKRKETPVKFNPGLSANRPSNNWALVLITASHVRRESKTVVDSGFHAVDSRFQVLDSGFFVSETWIPDSGLLELFSGFQIPRIKIYQIPETGLPLMGD